jgi:dTDP-4-dehydrorhamnose 3,5-epimerase
VPVFRETALPGVIEIIADRHGDERGYFSEVYNALTWRDGGVGATFVQDNHSFSAAAGVLRGLHYQMPPFGQAKLVRVARGRVFDVAVDIRKGSPTCGRWVGVELSADARNQLFIPAGFAHGFLTLTESVEFLYKVSAPYSPAHDRSIRFDDPRIAIHWPEIGCDLVLSAKDRDAPVLDVEATGFVWEG